MAHAQIVQMHSMGDPMIQNGIRLHVYVFEKCAADKRKKKLQAKNERDANVDSILQCDCSVHSVCSACVCVCLCVFMELKLSKNGFGLHLV